MSKDIKPGDLVMVVRPTSCCGVANYGTTFVVAKYADNVMGRCDCCGYIELRDGVWVEYPDGGAYPVSRLKKIDPPSEGDSLPTRADMKLGAGDTVKS